MIRTDPSASACASYVKVWYWKGQGVSSSSLGYFPGHVALELCRGDELFYASFWPGKCQSEGNCTRTESHIHDNLTQDQFIEKRQRGKDFKLTSLNVDAMIQAFLNFKEKPYAWGALGSGIFRKSYERNCAGLTLYLLKVGGIKQLFHNQMSSSLSTNSVARKILGFLTGTYIILK